MPRSTIALIACALLLATPVAQAKRVSRYMAFGQDTLLGQAKDIGIRAQCVYNENGLGEDVLRIYATTGNQRTILAGLDEYNGNGLYLTPATLPEDSELLIIKSASGVEHISHKTDQGIVFSPDSLNGLGITAESTVLGLNSTGAESHDCLVSIGIDNIKKFKHARER